MLAVDAISNVGSRLSGEVQRRDWLAACVDMLRLYFLMNARKAFCGAFKGHTSHQQGRQPRC